MLLWFLLGNFFNFNSCYFPMGIMTQNRTETESIVNDVFWFLFSFAKFGIGQRQHTTDVNKYFSRCLRMERGISVCLLWSPQWRISCQSIKYESCQSMKYGFFSLWELCLSCWCSIKLPKSHRIPASVLLSFRALSTYSRAFIWAKPRVGVIFPSTGRIISQVLIESWSWFF